MLKSKSLKTVLSICLLSLSACNHLPPVPRHVQYGVHADVSTPGFFGVDNESGGRVHRRFSDPHMKAAQCLSADDYKALSAWVQNVVEIAKKRCE